MTDERQRLLDFLEKQLFVPALADNRDNNAAFRREDVAGLRSDLQRERERIRDAPSADELLLTFREAADRSRSDGLDARLARFDLPTFAGVRDETEKLAAALGVEGRPQPAHFPR